MQGNRTRTYINSRKTRPIFPVFPVRFLVFQKHICDDGDTCLQCQNADSLEHTFLECPVSIKFYQKVISWFNVSENTQINLSNEQFLFQNYTISPTVHRNLRRQLDLLLLFTKNMLHMKVFRKLHFF